MPPGPTSGRARRVGSGRPPSALPGTRSTTLPDDVAVLRAIIEKALPVRIDQGDWPVACSCGNPLAGAVCHCPTRFIEIRTYEDFVAHYDAQREGAQERLWDWVLAACDKHGAEVLRDITAVRVQDRMTNVRLEIRAAMVVEEKMTGLMADLERERTRWEAYATGRIPDFCWACYVEFDRVTGHVCPPDRDTPHR